MEISQNWQYQVASSTFTTMRSKCSFLSGVKMLSIPVLFTLSKHTHIFLLNSTLLVYKTHWKLYILIGFCATLPGGRCHQTMLLFYHFLEYVTSWFLFKLWVLLIKYDRTDHFCTYLQKNIYMWRWSGQAMSKAMSGWRLGDGGSQLL